MDICGLNLATVEVMLLIFVVLVSSALPLTSGLADGFYPQPQPFPGDSYHPRPLIVFPEYPPDRCKAINDAYVFGVETFQQECATPGGRICELEDQYHSCREKMGESEACLEFETDLLGLLDNCGELFNRIHEARQVLGRRCFMREEELLSPPRTSPNLEACYD